MMSFRQDAAQCFCVLYSIIMFGRYMNLTYS